MSSNAPKTIWTASTVLLMVLALVGTGVYVYGTNRYSDEVAAGEALRLEVATLRATQARMEKSVERLDQLPPMAKADWEKALTDQINAAVTEAGARIVNLTYSSQMDEAEGGLGGVAFTLEMSGGSTAQAQCLALLEENVAGLRFGDIDGMLGGGDPDYLWIMAQAEAMGGMTITGTVYCEAGGAS